MVRPKTRQAKKIQVKNNDFKEREGTCRISESRRATYCRQRSQNDVAGENVGSGKARQRPRGLRT